ncbi:hypothetical protein BDZ91DRAFT_723745 [Kalaharituber pfeilii]|nr:hypothetical protein BDZ91DRAFT_723745 [Kalaharituber pfeilii]
MFFCSTSSLFLFSISQEASADQQENSGTSGKPSSKTVALAWGKRCFKLLQADYQIAIGVKDETLSKLNLNCYLLGCVQCTVLWQLQARSSPHIALNCGHCSDRSSSPGHRCSSRQQGVLGLLI